MKKIEVVAAILHKEDKFFATQRGYGEFEGFWEFPGGKMELGETPEGALKREIQEELGIDIKVETLVCTVEHNYPDFHLTMHCFMATMIDENVELREHKSAKWLSTDTLYNVNWLPADVKVLSYLT